MSVLRKTMQASTYAYGRVLIIVAPIPILHFGYWSLYNYGSPRIQERWGLDKRIARNMYFRRRLIVDRRRKAIEKLRDDYEHERRIFKIEFEKWVHRQGPDTPAEFQLH
mmetsp:Transcript_52156/g.83105  ORF Transcript_52156/g.83105 Transcript_52156/m.83105 type:complete len:109 (+) Transcript_52156:34-360(+)